jgi:hypothetical protein
MDKESTEQGIAAGPAEENGVAESLPHLADVLAWLRGAGWRATKTSVYRHQREGKLRPAADGSYPVRAVERYAQAWLKRQETGKRLQEDQDELQRRKLTLEIKNQEIELERKRFAHERELGRYIPREEFDLELAGRAGILYLGVKRWLQSRAAEWIAIAGGCSDRTAELSAALLAGWEEHINTYAAPREYAVELEEGDNEKQGDLEIKDDTS